MRKYFILSLFLAPLVFSQGNNNSDFEAKGFFAPSGPPTETPVRMEVGKSCLVELKQSYKISGTFSGSLEIDYRILVDGPCNKPAGTYDEEWIAFGTFNGTINEKSVTGKFSYTANVKAGGDINGKIIFGQGVEGELNVRGNFKGGKLSYDGWTKKIKF